MVEGRKQEGKGDDIILFWFLGNERLEKRKKGFRFGLSLRCELEF